MLKSARINYRLDYICICKNLRCNIKNGFIINFIKKIIKIVLYLQQWADGIKLNEVTTNNCSGEQCSPYKTVN